MLDDRVREFGCRVELIDLRWGAASADDDDEFRQGRILDVCLAEIDRARPLFVGLLGERRGWVPPKDRALRAARAAGIDTPVDGKSLTTMEFEHGVLDRQGARGIFFLRTLIGTPPDGFVDDDAAAVQALRKRVVQHGVTGASSTSEYVVLADSQGGLDYSAFDRLAIDVLGAEVEARARELVATDVDAYALAEALFFDDRLATVVGRDDVIAATADLLDAGTSVCLIGASGVGKSSVWCRLVENLRVHHRVVVAPVGSAPGLTSERGVIERLAGQLGFRVPQDVDDDALVEWWRAAVREHDDVVIAIDGLDGLDPGATRDRLRMVVSTDAQLLVTTTDTRHADLLTGIGVHAVSVKPFAEQQVSVVAETLVAQRHRVLPAQAIALLAAQPRSPLWLVLAIGELSTLNEDDFTGVDPDADPVEELDRLIVSTVAQLPPDVPGLVARMVDRLEARYGRNATWNALASLALSRSGLAPLDVASVAHTDELAVAGMRHGLAGMVAARGTGGRLGFVHGAVRDAVAVRVMLSDRRYRCDIHRAIAMHLAGVDDADPIRIDDVQWHWLHVDDGDERAALGATSGFSDDHVSARMRRAGAVVGAAMAGGVDFATFIEARIEGPQRLDNRGVTYLADVIRLGLMRGAPQDALRRAAGALVARANQRLVEDETPVHRPGAPTGFNNILSRMALVAAYRAAIAVADDANVGRLNREALTVIDGMLAEEMSSSETARTMCVIKADIASDLGPDEGTEIMREAVELAEQLVVPGGLTHHGDSPGLWFVEHHHWTIFCLALERGIAFGVVPAVEGAERVLRYSRELVDVNPQNPDLRRNLAGALLFSAEVSGGPHDSPAIDILTELIRDTPDDDHSRAMLDRARGRNGVGAGRWWLSEVSGKLSATTDVALAARFWAEVARLAARRAADDPGSPSAQLSWAIAIRKQIPLVDTVRARQLAATALGILRGVAALDAKATSHELAYTLNDFTRDTYVTTELWQDAIDVSRMVAQVDPNWPHAYRARSAGDWLARAGEPRTAADAYVESGLALLKADDRTESGMRSRHELAQRLADVIPKLRLRDMRMRGECVVLIRSLTGID